MKPSFFKFKNSKNIEYEVYFSKPNSKHYGDACGICFDPEEERPKIFISPFLTEKIELNTIVHEFCHAFFWDKPEKDVYKYANTVAAVLYKLGWRKNKKEKDDKKRKSIRKLKK